MEWYESGLIAFFLVYALVYLSGAHRNSTLSKKVFNIVSAVLRKDFPIDEVSFLYE